MAAFETIPDLIGAFYDAAADEGDFASLAGRVARVFDCESAVLQVRGGFAGPVDLLGLTPNFTPTLLAQYVETYHRHDVWVQRSLAHPPGTVLGNDDLISDADYRSSIIYNEYARHTGTFYVLGSQFTVGAASGVMAVHADYAAGLFDQAAREVFSVLVGHVRRALELRQRLGRLTLSHDVMAALPAQSTVGIIVLDASQRLIFANDVADALLRAGEGIGAKRYRVYARAADSDTRLPHAILAATSPAGGRPTGDSAVMAARRDGAPLSLTVYPFRLPGMAQGGTKNGVLIFVADPDRISPPRRDLLQQMYRLTQAESKLFEALLAGVRLQDYAGRAGLSLATVKTQLARLFEKTGHTRQSDLIRHALSNPLLMGPIGDDLPR
jgi:DNA-binding CsgD family transcriptional regulator/PAS domain-containing protein